MGQRRIKAAFIRGGTSKGVFFHAGDLPADKQDRDAILLRALGSPDPYGRQLDGLGGGISSLSKAVMIAPSARDDADVDFTFAQVAVDEPFVDYAGTCGNLSSAVGPFAIDEGMVARTDGEVVVRVFNTNTQKVFHSRFDVMDGEAITGGGVSVPGVTQTGARIALEFLSPGGSMTGDVLPTGAVVDELVLEDRSRIAVSMVDATNPIVFVAARDVGIAATEHPDALESDDGVMVRLEAIRQAAGVAMELIDREGKVPKAVPKIAVVAAPVASVDLQGKTIPAETVDVIARAVSMERVHRALPLTLAMCLATACQIKGTVPNSLMDQSSVGDVRMGNPSGVIVAGADAARSGNGWAVERCRVIRTQRRLMEGHVLV